MQFTLAAAATLLAVASATKNGTYPAYTTEVVTAYTTYCPQPTKITHNGNVYTVTKATTLTITDCPCTVTKPVLSSAAPPAETHPAQPPVLTHVPYPSANATSKALPQPPATGSPVASSPPAFTGAANKMAASGAGLAAVFGLAAYVL